MERAGVAHSLELNSYRLRIWPLAAARRCKVVASTHWRRAENRKLSRRQAATVFVGGTVCGDPRPGLSADGLCRIEELSPTESVQGLGVQVKPTSEEKTRDGYPRHSPRAHPQIGFQSAPRMLPSAHGKWVFPRRSSEWARPELPRPHRGSGGRSLTRTPTAKHATRRTPK